MPTNENESTGKPPYTIEHVFAFFSPKGGNINGQLSRIYDFAGLAATEDDVLTFEKQIGFQLPTDFRQFSMSPLGGLYMSVKKQYWPDPKPGEHGALWMFLSGIKVFGLAAQTPHWIDMRVKLKEFRSNKIDGLVPFLQRESDPNCYCFQNDAQIVHWQRDSGETSVVDTSFASLLMKEIEELAVRLKRRLELTQK